LKGRKIETKSAAAAPATLVGTFSAEEDALLQDVVDAASPTAMTKDAEIKNASATAASPTADAGIFSAEDDALVRDAVESHQGIVSWPTIAILMNRTESSVKSRWYGHLCLSVDAVGKRPAPQPLRQGPSKRAKIENDDVTLPKEVTNAKLVHGKYSAEEDAKLVRAMETTPAPSWLEISKLLNRSVGSVENRWDLRHTRMASFVYNGSNLL
jgi:hypothetical protein